MLDDFKRAQQRDVEKGDYVMPPPPAPLPSPGNAWKEFHAAMDSWDEPKADRAMTTYRLRTSGRSVSIAFVIGSILFGCSSHRAGDTHVATPDERDQVEIACEIALLQLEGLIEKRLSQNGFPLAVLIEARELQRMGKELYLEREYELALQLIAEAIEMLEEEND